MKHWELRWFGFVLFCFVLIVHRYQFGIVQPVRDERKREFYQPKEREFYQLLQIVVLRLMLDNFNFISFPKKFSILQMQVLTLLAEFLFLKVCKRFEITLSTERPRRD